MPFMIAALCGSACLGLSSVDELEVRWIRHSEKDIMMSSLSHILLNDLRFSDVQYETICDCSIIRKHLVIYMATADSSHATLCYHS